jgi:hypothetical protein
MPSSGVDRLPESRYTYLSSDIGDRVSDIRLSQGGAATMRGSRDSDRRFGSALWGHGYILAAIGLLAALISFPTGW